MIFNPMRQPDSPLSQRAPATYRTKIVMIRTKRCDGENKDEESHVPTVYREMVQEAVAGEASAIAVERPLKKRRTATAATQCSTVSGYPGRNVEWPADINDVGKSAEEDSDGSDVDWEEVDLDWRSPSPSMNHLIWYLTNSVAIASTSSMDSAQQPLELILDDNGKRKDTSTRRKITAVERRIRLETHKLHILCLIYHVYMRSRWCDDLTVKVPRYRKNNIIMEPH